MSNFKHYLKTAVTSPIKSLKAKFILYKSNDNSLPSKRRDIVLFFVPEAGVQLFLETHYAFALRLKNLGYTVVFVRCYNIFSRCQVMDLVGLPVESTKKQRKTVCTECLLKFEKVVVENQLDFFDMRKFLKQEELKDIDVFLEGYKEKLLDCNFREIKIGILAFSEMAIGQKISINDNQHLNKEHHQLWLDYTKTAMLACVAVENMIKQYSIAKIVVFNEYGINLAVKKVAENHGVMTKIISLTSNKSGDKRFPLIYHESYRQDRMSLLKNWPKYREIPLNELQIKEIMDGILYKQEKKGSHTYSPAKSRNNLKQSLKIPENKIVLVCYTSSLDELNAAIMSYTAFDIDLSNRDDAFKDQTDWLLSLIKFVEENDDFFLIIRMHPRMGITHRDKVVSYEVKIYSDLLKEKQYKNVNIIWPEEPISSYDLSEIADCALTAWSSIGTELAILGIPVLSGLKHFHALPTKEKFFQFFAHSEQYFNKLKEMKVLSSESAQQEIDYLSIFQNIKYAFRWYFGYNFGQSIDLFNQFDLKKGSDRDINQNYCTDTPVDESLQKIKSALIDNKNVLEMNYKSMQLKNTPYNSQENKAIVEQIYRYIHFVLTGLVETAKKIAILPHNHSNIEHIKDSHLIYCNKTKTIWYSYGNKLYECYSPMVTRLAKTIYVFLNSETPIYV